MQTNMSKNASCNGRVIRYYREQRGWTQMELAVHADMSERLVRKAEADGSCREDSLELLAAALSTASHTLHAADLSSDPLALAQAYMRSYLDNGAESARKSAHLFAPDVVMAIHTDAANLAFAGEFVGVDGIEQMIRHAYSQFTPVGKDWGRWSVAGPRVVALCKETLQATGHPNAPLLETWITHEYTIQNGVIARIDNWIDSLAWSRYLEQTGTDRESVMSSLGAKATK